MTDFSRLMHVHPYYLSRVAALHDYRITLPDERFSGIATLVGAALKLGAVSDALEVLDSTNQWVKCIPGRAYVGIWRAVVYAADNQLDVAHTFSSIAVSLAPHHPGILEVHAGILVRLRRFEEVEAVFQKIVTIDDTRGWAWGSLAVMYALAGHWDKAKHPAAVALGLNVDIGGHLVQLCLTFAKIYTGEDPAPLLSVPADTSPEALIARLPEVGGTFVSPGPAGAPIVFVACDGEYLKDHVPALVWSLERQGKPVTLHIHVYNPGPEIDIVMPMLDERFTCITLNVTAEIVDREQFSPINVYYSSARFCRVWQLLMANDVPVLVVDADTLFRKPAQDFPGLGSPHHDVGFSYAENGPPWDRYIAFATAFNPTSAGRDFVGRVAAIIADNLLSRRAKWFIDQIALTLVAERDDCSARLLKTPTSESCTSGLSEAAVLWAVTVDKTSNSKYNKFKRQLLAEYGDPGGVARMDDNPNEIVESRYGKMILNKNDMWVCPTIKRCGTWCSAELEAMQAFIQSGDVVIDVGANFGFHTLAFSEMVGPRGTVYAFEPQRLVWQNVIGSLALNWVRNVHCFNAAAGREAGIITVPPINYGTSNNIGAVSLRDGWTGTSEVSISSAIEGENVSVIPLDDLGLQRCALIKIDVEGMEADVLAGAVDLIDRLAPVIYVEYHADNSTITDFLRSRGYTLYFHDVTGNPNVLALPPSAAAPPDLPGLSLMMFEDALA